MIRSVAVLSYHTCPLTVPGVGDAGGMNVSVHEQALSLARRGVAVDVYTRRGDPDIADVVEVVPGYRVFHVAAGPPERMPIADQAPFVDDFAAAVLAAIDRSGSSPDVVHSHYWLSGRAGLTVAESLGRPLANSFHTLGRVKDLTRRPDDARSSSERVEAETDVIAGSACVIASTPLEARDLLEHYGADPTRLCVNPPGVDLTTFSPGDREAARKEAGFGPGPLVVVAGRVQPLKGIDVALEAVARLRRSVPDVHLAVVGGASGEAGSEELGRLRDRAANPDLAGAVSFRPAVPHTDVVPILRSADVVHVPSRSESFGLVAVEAQACGIPVVATAVGGLRHVVADGVSGVLVEGWDPADHAAALERVLVDDTWAATLAAGTVPQASRFGWESTTDRLLELYAGIVGARA
jgi:D-inositol-3-phosphate glycosyltransferase